MIGIRIHDEGIGIPKDKQKVIFERFRQADRLLTRSHEGSGKGLSLVKSLVEMHEGRISVKSEPGKGSEFIVELPAVPLKDAGNSGRKHGRVLQDRVERLHIEFSDIYS
jgi:two-component system CheB/CheR fusion protein